VLKPGGRAAFVAWGKKEQPFFTTTAGVVLKHVPVPPPPPDPDGPSLFMFGERDRLRRALQAAGSTMFMKKTHHRRALAVVGRRVLGAVQRSRRALRPLIEQLTPEKMAQAKSEIFAALEKILGRQRIEHASRNRHRHGHAPLSGILLSWRVPSSLLRLDVNAK